MKNKDNDPAGRGNSPNNIF